jgi:shikimate dehydrogenase
MHLTARTKLCALIGNPVEHSLSPLIHNAAFKEKGLDFAYVAFRVEPARLESAVKGLAAFDIRGASITIPHKIHVVKYVDRLDPVARKIGSINTIVNDGDCLWGYNSDGTGALKAFRDRAVDLGGKSVLILGSGGAARAIGVTLAMQTDIEELCIAGTTQEKVAELVNHLHACAHVPVRGEAFEKKRFDPLCSTTQVLINCTPVGMYPEVAESPVPLDFLHQDMIVFDAVYNPPRTQLLMDAEKAGCTVISGLDMFVHQAAVQFELWSGEKAPVALMRKVIVERLGLTEVK